MKRERKRVRELERETENERNMKTLKWEKGAIVIEKESNRENWAIAIAIEKIER